MNNRASNIAIARVLLIFAALMTIASCYFVYAASSFGRPQSLQILAAQCAKELEAVGFKSNIRPQDHAIVSFQSATDLMQERVNASSVAIGRCAGYRLVEFCAGSGCSKPGVFFVLEPF